MKIFLDTANVSEIKEGIAIGVVDGVTTNPSLIAKEKRPFRPLVEEICGIVPGDVSLEVVATDFEGMVKEGEELAQVAKNAVVKCPLTKDGLKAVKYLSGKGIRCNQTLCFSAPQALLSAKAGATYISPFLGRLDDIGAVGMDLIRDICQIYKNYGIVAVTRGAGVSRLSLDLLGPFHVRLEAGPALALRLKKAQALLAYLSLPIGRPATRETLCGLLWPSNADDEARHSLRQTLFALKHALGPAYAV